MARPQVNAEAQKELDKTESQIEDFKSMMKSYNPMDNRKEVMDEEPIVKLSNREMNLMDAPVIRPVRSVARPHSRDNDPKAPKTFWNEKFQKMRDYDWEYVKCKVENRELINSEVETWTAKYGCDPAHFWKVPVNKPVYIPRLLASQLSQCKYNKIVMEEHNETRWKQHSSDAVASYVGGGLAVEQTVNRINAVPVAASF